MPKRKIQEEEDLEIGEAPTSINPYEILSIAPDATAEQVKSAYRKAALKHHPDKAAPEDKQTAHQLFQEVAFAYAVLSDERRRKRYDTTGRTEESLDLDDDDFDWGTYFREQFHEVITAESIQKFSDDYRGSAEEREHVLHFYTKHKGSMERLYQEVMLSDMAEDEPRFRAIIDEAIADGEAEAFKKYTAESEDSRRKRIDRAKKRKEQEAKEAEKAEAEMEEERGKNGKKGGRQGKKSDEGLGDLAAMIQKRQKNREEDFFANLEAKYAPKGKSGKMQEPPEEAFARNAKGGAKAKRAKR